MISKTLAIQLAILSAVFQITPAIPSPTTHVDPTPPPIETGVKRIPDGHYVVVDNAPGLGIGKAELLADNRGIWVALNERRFLIATWDEVDLISTDIRGKRP